MAQRKIEVVVVGDSSSLEKALGRAGTSATKFGRTMGQSTRGLTSFIAAGAGIATVGVAFQKAVGATIGFDRAMRNVNSIAQKSEGQFKSLEGQVLKLAGKTAQAPETLAKGLYDLVSSGFNAGQSMKILESSAKAATAGLTDTATSTHAVAAILNAYHLPASKAAKVSDQLFQTVNRGVVSFDELSSQIGDVLPYAAQLHVGLSQVGAAISTMTKQGLSGSEATVRLKNAMITFIKPGKDMAAAIEQTGFSSGEALIKAKGFQGALEAVLKTGNGSKEDLASLFRNIRSIGGALALTGINAKTAHGDLKAFKDVTGATDTALKEQSKSIAYQWNQVKATVSAAAISIGTGLIPKLASAVAWLKKMAAEFKAGNPTVVALTASITGLITALAAYKVINMARNAILALNLAMDANPAILITAAIVGLGVAMVIAYKKSETFRNVVNGVFNAVKSVVTGAISLILGQIELYIRGLGLIASAASHLPLVGGKFRGIADAVNGAADSVGRLRDQINGLPKITTVHIKTVIDGQTISGTVTSKDALTPKPATSKGPRAKTSMITRRSPLNDQIAAAQFAIDLLQARGGEPSDGSDQRLAALLDKRARQRRERAINPYVPGGAISREQSRHLTDLARQDELEAAQLRAGIQQRIADAKDAANQRVVEENANRTEAASNLADEQRKVGEAIKALTEQIKTQNQYAKAVSSVGMGSAWRALADLVSGQIVGYGYAPRAQTAGSGVGARY